MPPSLPPTARIGPCSLQKIPSRLPVRVDATIPFPPRCLSTSTVYQRLRRLPSAHAPASRCFATTLPARAQTAHRRDIDDYYAELLAQPLPVSAATSRPIRAAVPPADTDAGDDPLAATAPTPARSVPADDVPRDPAAQTPAQRARIVFGSRLLPPAARQANLEEAKARGEGQWMAGRWIPPRPSEPDNCCMSGCVNCVWDVYRDDLEGWVATRREARAEERRIGGRQLEGKRGKGETGNGKARERRTVAEGIQGDEDGMASGVIDTLGDEEAIEDLMQDIPVGIREFMRTEKRLRDQHRMEEGATT